MDGTVRFEVQPHCGMPQGAPASPMIYSVLMEELLSLAEARLSVNCHHAGLRLSTGERTQSDVQRARDVQRPFVAGDPVFCKFADDTYVLADTPDSLSCVCSVVAAAASSKE